MIEYRTCDGFWARIIIYAFYVFSEFLLIYSMDLVKWAFFWVLWYFVGVEESSKKKIGLGVQEAVGELRELIMDWLQWTVHIRSQQIPSHAACLNGIQCRNHQL